MPRNSAGVYSVPNVFTPNTVISSTQVNANFSDVGTALTDSLDRQGRGGMQANLDLGGFRVVNSADPQSNTDLVTLQWAANANNLTTGTIPDARLSANIPRLNAQNTFTHAQSAGAPTSAIYLDSNAPAIGFRDADGTANNRIYDIIADGGTLAIRAANDSLGVVTNAIVVTNVNGVVSSLALTGTSIPLNSANIVAGALRATATNSFGASGVGAELEVVSGEAYFTGFNRTTSQFVNSRFRGLNVLLESNNGTVQANGREVGFRGGEQNEQSAGYTFQATDKGRAVAANSAGNFTVPAGTFTTGDIITFINTTGSNCTLVQGAGVTLRLLGSTLTGNRTVSSFGLATIYAQNSTTFLVGGPGVT